MLLKVYAILAATGAILIPLLLPQVSFWWMPLLLAGGFLGLVLLHILFTSFVALCVSKRPVPDHVHPFFRFWMSETNRLLTWFFNVRVHVTGAELLPRTERFLIVSNHLSRFDPMLCLAMLPDQPLTYISKESNFHIPVARQFMRQCRFLSIDRDNARNALVTIRKASEMVASGELSVGIYPEGTRSKTGLLQPFRNGAFKIALYARSPIVVMTVHGTDQVAKNAPFKRTRVDLCIRAVLPYESIRGLHTADISARVRAIMLEPAGAATITE